MDKRHYAGPVYSLVTLKHGSQSYNPASKFVFMTKKFAYLSALLWALPLAASAQMQPLAKLIGAIASLLGALVPILVTLGLVVFLWGLARYLWGKGGKADIEGAKKLIKWGLITLFVMVSVWGIIGLLQTGLGIDRGAKARAPGILFPGAGGYTSVDNATIGDNKDYVNTNSWGGPR